MNHRIRSWIGVTFVIVCTVFFAFQVRRLLHSDAIDFSESIRLLPPSLHAYMAAYIAFALGWHYLLIAAGVVSRWSVDIGVFATSQFAKYLPGNVAHHAGRVALAVQMGQPAYSVLTAMVIEIMIVMGLMVVFSLPYLAYWLIRVRIEESSLWLAALTLLLTLAVSAAILLKLKHYPCAAGMAEALKLWGAKGWYSLIIRLFLAASLVCAGILLTALSLAWLDDSHTLAPVFPVVLGIFAVSWVLGFLVPGAPAGIGVREVVLTEGLAPFIGRNEAVVVALLFRIISTLADILVFVIGLVLLRFAIRSHRADKLS